MLQSMLYNSNCYRLEALWKRKLLGLTSRWIRSMLWTRLSATSNDFMYNWISSICNRST